MHSTPTAPLADAIYGKFTITSKVLVELVSSNPFQRLKGIAQFGIPDEYYHLKNYSRFDHCIGVMMLLKLLGAGEEEQIAGLLHDVSHTAFSHVIDWVVGDGKTENFQDQQHVRFLTTSDIAGILQKYGYDPSRIADYHYFGLLEQELPDLCADRIDYSVREFPILTARECIADLTVNDHKIVFTHTDIALLFAKQFLNRQMEHWGGFEAASRYRIFADALRIAIKQHIITKDDFWQTDAFVVNKLINSGNKKILRILHVLEQKSLAQLPKSTVTVQKKFRYVDPLIKADSKILRLSTLNKQFAQELKHARELNAKGITVPDVR
jgi:hypothetical protein